MPNLSEKIAFHLPKGLACSDGGGYSPLALPWCHPWIGYLPDLFLSVSLSLQFRILKGRNFRKKWKDHQQCETSARRSAGPKRRHRKLVEFA